MTVSPWFASVFVLDAVLGTRRTGRLMNKPDCASVRRGFAFRASGFTLVELVGVMVIIGILALFALPRFYSLTAFDTRAFQDEITAMMRYAQKTAIAQRRCVFVNAVAATRTVSLVFDQNGDCATQAAAVIDPATNAPYVRTAPSSIGISSAAFGFNALGSPVPDAAVSMTITGDVVRTVTVERNTGYVH